MNQVTMTIKIIRLQLLLIVSFFLTFESLSQPIDSASFKINTRLSFYTYEKDGEFLLSIPQTYRQNNLLVSIKIDNNTIATWSGKPGGIILRIPFKINMDPSVYNVEAKIVLTGRSEASYSAKTNLIVLQYKPNEVKTDNLTGGLIVNKRQFFPFGFYCYSPVYPTLPEEEVVRGFNMMSPYQKIMPESLNERIAYMDRCAELGLKVNYNLLSVSGGGGVGSKIEGLSDEEKRERLAIEITTFKDHPALLGWYISDEPNGYNIPPEKLEEIYKSVKEKDPWHPVSIVFMAPFLASGKYSSSFDIVMADPYPIPDLPVTVAGDIAGQLKGEFNGRKPVWMASQSFGGGEIWGREPTSQEIRSMTWQSIIKGASGIQYFVRQGLNYFPKSLATWGECGRIAMEVAELTPWLLSDEETFPVVSYSDNILVTSRMHNGQLIVIAVNKINEPTHASIRITSVSNGKARVIFENRSVQVNNGFISDQIAAYGSQVYLINIKPDKKELVSQNMNLLKDPDFEDISSPGIPSACYARPGGDRGATYFIDTREHYKGNHSLKINTPKDDKSVIIRFFPVPVRAGESYTISVWAKSDPEQRHLSATKQENDRLLEKKEMPQYVEILFGEFGHARFIPDKDWRRYVAFVTIPSDTLTSFRTNLILKMPGNGVAWFDDFKVFKEK
jgi:hypothetical protein